MSTTASYAAEGEPGMSKQSEFAALDAFITWVMDAMEYVSVPRDATPALDALLSFRAELKREAEQESHPLKYEQVLPSPLSARLFPQ